MPQSNFSEFVKRLHSDTLFREEFANSPAQALLKAGFDPEMFVLPKSINYDELTARLNKVFSGAETVTIDDPTAVAKLSADELWKRFSVIGLTEDAKRLIPGAGDPGTVTTVSATASTTRSVATAVVIYGSSLVVSNASSVVTSQGHGLGVKSIEQLQVLRRLSKLPKDQLVFSVTGPDGVAAHNLPTDVMRAFLSRIR